MRLIVSALVLALWGAGLLGRADENSVQAFSGTQPLTTALFTVQDNWEVRWDSPAQIAITLLSSDGKIVAGMSGSAKGSLYQSKGGSFYLQINEDASGGTSPWHVSIVEIGSATMADSQTNIVSNYVPPATIPAPGSTNVVSTPAAPTPVSPAPPPASPASASGGTLTDEQQQAVVVIKGDIGEGTGFLVKTPDGPAVMTNLHVLAANTNVHILSTTGAEIKMLSVKGASDRDLAMIGVQDNHYNYLQLADYNKDAVQADDEVITPGNSEGGEVVLDTKGKLLAIGPERIEFSNPVYHGNSGGPVFHTKSGKVLGVVTMGMKVRITNDLDKASYNNSNSAITSTMRYFGLRLDTVPQWETYDWDRFLNQTTFLKDFHQVSVCLDSYMNGARYEQAHIATPNGENGPPDSKFWQRNDKMQAAYNSFHELAVNADNSQKQEALRGLAIDLQGVADTDMIEIQDPSNFYSYEQVRAKQEIDYRTALKKEIDTIGTHPN